MRLSKPVYAWAIYDWANSAFATTVMAGFFPLFFKQYWSTTSESTLSTFHLGVGNSIAALMVVVMAPILGAIADKGGVLKGHLLCFAAFGVIMTAALYAIAKDEWLAALVCYGAATVGFMGANVFYDALLVSIIDEGRRNLVSSLGFALGYLGGGLLFSINVAMTLAPGWFGLSSAADAVQLSFLTVAVWWGLFTVPLWLYVREPRHTSTVSGRRVIAAGLLQLWVTAKAVKQLRPVLLFLLAYWFYIDGVDTVVRMAVDYGLSLGLQQNDLIVALLIAQFVGFPATLAYGFLGQKIGTKLGLYIGVIAYILITIWAYFIQYSWEFYALAVAIGLVQGGIQALSRSYYSILIPKGREGEFFGFYNMMGKSAAIIGPLLVGYVSVVTESHRLGMLSIIVLFVIGGLLLTRTPSTLD